MRFTKQILSFLAILLFLVYLGVNVTMIRVLVPTGSMLNTIQLNQVLLVEKDSFVKHYSRGDIVVFYEDGEIMIKRLIGLPGETVRIEQGTVFIDGQLLSEDYLGSNTSEYDGTFKVPKDNYFFLGDNRSISFDARLWKNPYVPKSSLLGKAVYYLYPTLEHIELPDYTGGDRIESD